jgi:hypothetical protein
LYVTDTGVSKYIPSRIFCPFSPVLSKKLSGS